MMANLSLTIYNDGRYVGKCVLRGEKGKASRHVSFERKVLTQTSGGGMTKPTQGMNEREDDIDDANKTNKRETL